MNGIGCDHCCAMPPGQGPECMCECHDNGESPLVVAARCIAEVPLDDLREYVASMPAQESTCRTCGERIRTTPAVHTDGSVNWASGGWEHIETEKSGCEWEFHPYGFATPIT